MRPGTSAGGSVAIIGDEEKGKFSSPAPLSAGMAPGSVSEAAGEGLGLAGCMGSTGEKKGRGRAFGPQSPGRGGGTYLALLHFSSMSSKGIFFAAVSRYPEAGAGRSTSNSWG